MLPGMTVFRLGKAHALLNNPRDAASFLESSVTRLEPLTGDPVIGKDAQRLTEQARQLLHSAS
jgi:hypothetical protein